MSLDTLFKQIFLTEQQLNEQTQRNKEGWNGYLSVNWASNKSVNGLCIYVHGELNQTLTVQMRQ